MLCHNTTASKPAIHACLSSGCVLSLLCHPPLVPCVLRLPASFSQSQPLHPNRTHSMTTHTPLASASTASYHWYQHHPRKQGDGCDRARYVDCGCAYPAEVMLPLLVSCPPPPLPHHPPVFVCPPLPLRWSWACKSPASCPARGMACLVHRPSFDCGVLALAATA